MAIIETSLARMLNDSTLASDVEVLVEFVAIVIIPSSQSANGDSLIL